MLLVQYSKERSGNHTCLRDLIVYRVVNFARKRFVKKNHPTLHKLYHGKPLETATVSGITTGSELHVSTQPLEKSEEQVGVCRQYAKRSKSAEELKPSDGSNFYAGDLLESTWRQIPKHKNLSSVKIAISRASRPGFSTMKFYRRFNKKSHLLLYHNAPPSH